MGRRMSRAWCAAWCTRATTWCSSGRARSRSGLMRCRASSQRGSGTARGDVLPFPDIIPALKAALPQLRGRLLANQALADLIWFRVGGPAQVLFMPEDEEDLAYLLAHLPQDLP